jgi:hypothetical protein
MAVVYVVAGIVIVGWFVALSVNARIFAGDQAILQQFQASLAKHLPPDVQAELMKCAKLGRVTTLAMIAVAFAILIMMFGMMETWRAAAAIIERVCRVLTVVGLAAWAVSIAGTLLDRRSPGEVLADLSPHLLAGAIRRGQQLVLLVLAPVLYIFFRGFQTAGDWPPLALWVAFALLILLRNRMYSDRVWLAERGLYFGGKLYPWDGFERVAWTDDGRAFALRRRPRWRLQRWTLVPVPEGSREATEEALRRVMPDPTPTL